MGGFERSLNSSAEASCLVIGAFALHLHENYKLIGNFFVWEVDNKPEVVEVLTQTCGQEAQSRGK